MDSIRNSRVKAMDETPVKAGRKERGKMRLAYFRPAYGEHNEVCFPFFPSPDRENVRAVLSAEDAPNSVILTDGYAAYASYAKKFKKLSSPGRSPRPGPPRNRTWRFPPSGSSVDVSCGTRTIELPPNGHYDASCGEREVSEEILVSLPREACPLATTLEPLKPASSNVTQEAPQTSSIPADPEVVNVALHSPP